MIRKLTLAAGFAAGYVLGAKAGTERYDQIVALVRQFAGRPEVQEVTSSLQQTAGTVADKAKDSVLDKVNTLNDKIDITTPGDRTATSAPMAGAAASRTAPDL